MVLVVIANLYVARHYKRWDVTKGGLYTLSEHVAPPLTYAQVLANLQHMLDRLVLIHPRS